MAASCAVLLAVVQTAPRASQTAPAAQGTVSLDADDIGGTVTGPKGPEAGVWVIAETTSLPTRFVRIVVEVHAARLSLSSAATRA